MNLLIYLLTCQWLTDWLIPHYFIHRIEKHTFTRPATWIAMSAKTKLQLDLLPPGRVVFNWISKTIQNCHWWQLSMNKTIWCWKYNFVNEAKYVFAFKPNSNVNHFHCIFFFNFFFPCVTTAWIDLNVSFFFVRLWTLFLFSTNDSFHLPLLAHAVLLSKDFVFILCRKEKKESATAYRSCIASEQMWSIQTDDSIRARKMHF